MKGLTKLREEVHNRAITFRTIENIILRPRFTRLWVDSTDSEREEIEDIIKRGDRKGVNDWIKNHPSIDLGEKPFKHLREIARRLAIKNYARLGRLDLLVEIIEKENEHGQVGKS
jgi:hypothetical protein